MHFLRLSFFAFLGRCLISYATCTTVDAVQWPEGYIPYVKLRCVTALKHPVFKHAHDLWLYNIKLLCSFVLSLVFKLALVWIHLLKTYSWFRTSVPIETMIWDLYSGDLPTTSTRSRVFAMDTQSRKINAGRGAGHPLSSVLGNNAAALQPLLSTPCLAFWGLAPPSRILAYEINTINAVALKLPELWQSKVRSWFAQAEAKFVTSGVTMSLTKYQCPAGELHRAHSRAPRSTGWRPVLRLEAPAKGKNVSFFIIVTEIKNLNIINEDLRVHRTICIAKEWSFMTSIKKKNYLLGAIVGSFWVLGAKKKHKPSCRYFVTARYVCALYKDMIIFKEIGNNGTARIYSYIVQCPLFLMIYRLMNKVN